MKNVFRVLKRDILRLLKVPPAVVVILALLVLPSLYTWSVSYTHLDVYKRQMYRYGLTQAMPDMCLEVCEEGGVKGVWIQTSNGIACMSGETCLLYTSAYPSSAGIPIVWVPKRQARDRR